MSQRMTDEAVNLALGSIVLGLSRGARPATVDRACSDLKELGPEIGRARSEEARLLEEAKAKDVTIKALADALRAMRAAFPHAYASQEEADAADAADAALRLDGRLA